MAQRIDYYILSTPSLSDGYAFICQLAEKAYLQGHGLTLQCHSEAEAQTLDQQLWSFRDTSFLPHQIEPKLKNCVQIGQPKMLLNLTLPETQTFADWHRVLQIVPNDPLLKQRARNQYRSFQQQGIELKTHPIDIKR